MMLTQLDAMIHGAPAASTVRAIQESRLCLYPSNIKQHQPLIEPTVGQHDATIEKEAKVEPPLSQHHDQAKIMPTATRSHQPLKP